VGDDAQSIYSFRGATIRNILEFPEQFPGAACVTLEQNYRSTQPILDAANALIAQAPRGYGKTLWTDRRGGDAPLLVAARDEHEQTQWVVHRLLEFHEQGTPLSEMAVLFRAGYMSADLEIELTNRQIPFEKWGGLKFLEAAHVKDVLAFLRVLENPRDEVSWFRLLLLLPGIGDVSARRAIEVIAAHGWDPAALAAFTPPARARDALASLTALLAEARTATPDPDAPVSVDVARIRALYDGILRARYDRVEPRLADLDQLLLIAANFPTRAAFLAELALEPPSATQDLAGASRADEDALILSTAHSAKGREWDAVFVIWAADGWFPSVRSLRTPDEVDEERRLMYVAMTRARRELTVTYPLYTYAARLGAEYAIDQPSRFLDADVRAHMRLLGVGGPSQASAARDGAPGNGAEPATAASLDVRALLRKRFGA
jgi:DNA helicase-2/ATP-dependent DNA helicase PcrA